MTKRWLFAFLFAGLFGGNAFADCVPSPNTPASVIEYFQKLNKPLPEKFCAKEDVAPQRLRNPHKNLLKSLKMSRPHLNPRSYLLSTSLFQSRGIPLPMALGLGSRLNGCIQSYTGTTTKITNISTTNISTTTTTTTEATTSHGWGN
jgi:hypothetical protein